MKELLLYRHAKAEDASRSIADQDRALAAVGRKQAQMQGEILAGRDLRPEHVVASDALRAQQTVRETAGAMRYTGRVDYLPALYDADYETYSAVLRKQPEGIQRLMIVGHNPAIEETATRMTGRRIHLKAGSIAYLGVETKDWASIDSATKAELKEIFVPDA